MDKVSTTVIRIGAKDVGVAYNYKVNANISTSGMRVYTSPDFLNKGKICSIIAQDILKKEKALDIRIECLVFNCSKKICLVKFGAIDDTYTMYSEQEITNDKLLEALVQLHINVKQKLEDELNYKEVQTQSVKKRAKKKTN